MSKRAAVIWLLDGLESTGPKAGLVEASLTARQIRAVGAKLLVEFFKQGVEFVKENLLAFSKHELHWLVKDSLGRFGFQVTENQKMEGIVWSKLTNICGGYYNMPDIIVVVSPTKESEPWVRKLMGYGREVWTVRSPDADLGKLEFLARVIPMSALKKVEKPPPKDFHTNALVLLDIENFVPVHFSTGGIAVEQAEVLISAVAKYLANKSITIDGEQSFVCLKKHCPIELELARIMACYGIRMVPAPRFHEPAEQRIVNGVKALEREKRIAFGRGPIQNIAVIMSGDRHVIPAVYALKEKKIPVWVIAWWDNANKGLRDCADLFIPLESLLGSVSVHCEQKRLKVV